MTLLTLILKIWARHPVRSAVMVLAIAIASFYLAQSPLLFVDLDGRRGRTFRVLEHMDSAETFDDLDNKTLAALREIDTPITFVTTVVLTLSAEKGEPVRMLVTAYHPIGKPDANIAVLSERLIKLLERQGSPRLDRGDGELWIDWGEGKKAIRYRSHDRARSWVRVPLAVLIGAARIQGVEVRANTHADRRVAEKLAALLGAPIDQTPTRGQFGLRVDDSDALVAGASWMLIGLLLLFAVHFDRTARGRELELVKRLGATSAQQRWLLLGDLSCSIALGVLAGLAMFVTIDDHALQRLSSLGGAAVVVSNLVGAAALVLLVAYVSMLRSSARPSASAPPDHRRWLLVGMAAFVVGLVLISEMNTGWLPVHTLTPWKVSLLLLSLVLFFGAGGFLVARIAGLIFGRLWTALGSRGLPRLALVGVRWLHGMDVVAAMVLAIAIGVVIMGAAYSHSWTGRKTDLPQLEALDFLPPIPFRWLRKNTQLTEDEIEPLRLVESWLDGKKTPGFQLAMGPKSLRAWQKLRTAWERETSDIDVDRYGFYRFFRLAGIGRVQSVTSLEDANYGVELTAEWRRRSRYGWSEGEPKTALYQWDLGLYVFVPGGIKTRPIDGSLRHWEGANLFYHAHTAPRPQPPSLFITAFRQQGKNPTLLGLLGLGMLVVVLAGVSLQQQRQQEVPFLKQLGATRGQIFWGSWIEQTLVCVLAAVGGCLLALLPTYTLLRTTATLFKEAAPPLVMPWSWIAQLSVLAVALPAIVLALLWWRTSGISIAATGER